MPCVRVSKSAGSEKDLGGPEIIFGTVRGPSAASRKKTLGTHKNIFQGVSEASARTNSVPMRGYSFETRRQLDGHFPVLHSAPRTLPAALLWPRQASIA